MHRCPGDTRIAEGRESPDDAHAVRVAGGSGGVVQRTVCHLAAYWAWDTLDMLKSGMHRAGIAVREK